VSIPSSPRYALYFTPKLESQLWRLGCAWLGRDPAGGVVDSRPAITGTDPLILEQVTRTPARYGFHGTLKAPFHLVEGRTEEDLIAALREEASRFPSPGQLSLKVGDLRGFLALVPEGDAESVNALAAWAVERFEPFRAALSEEDLLRRRKAGLTPRQDAALETWGYPYVFEDFAFHMTLSGQIEDATERDRILVALAEVFRPALDHAVPLDAISLFQERPEDKRFVLVERVSLGA